MDRPIHLSVVATSRNDNHGGSLTHRMQHFVDGFVAQCKRHDLRAELILVEWNPPADRVPLADELRWPADTGPCDIRIVTVPREVHERIQNAEKIPLFQMMAKNVGIRRARGKYVLATNIDILFSDAAMVRMRDGLRPGCLYRAARVDVPTEVPESDDFGVVLDFCEREGFRVHAPAGTVVRAGSKWTYAERLRARLDPRLSYLSHALRQLGRLIRGAARFSVAVLFSPRQAREKLGRFARSVSQDDSIAAPSVPLLASREPERSPPGALASILRYGLDRFVRVPQRLLLPWSFTNACGDFTLLALDDWHKLGGYPEWPVFSWHLDSILLYQAKGVGLREESFGPVAPVYHIEHGKGSGYTPEGADALFSSLVRRGIPFLSDAELWQVHSRIRGWTRSERGPLFNGPAWGMADLELPDRAVHAS